MTGMAVDSSGQRTEIGARRASGEIGRARLLALAGIFAFATIVLSKSDATARELPVQLAQEQTAPPRQTLSPPASPTIRHILVSQDPAGDVGLSCYLTPQTYPNGYTESPRALPGQCVVEITDTLRIEFSEGPHPDTLTVTGPGGFSRQLADAELYIELGMPLGEYKFVGADKTKIVKGGFTVKTSSKRVAQLRFKDREESAVDYLALAGYAPAQTISVYFYEQTSFRQDVGTGERKWRLGRSLGSVVADGRGEAKFQFNWASFNPKRNFLFVSEPFQENDLNSARIGDQ